MADRSIRPVDGQASPVLHDLPEPFGKLFGGFAGHLAGYDIARDIPFVARKLRQHLGNKN